MTSRSHNYLPQDRYFQQAKKAGYRSRAAFKLLEIDKKFHLFKQGAVIVDLGGAPGGWSQVALKAVGTSGFVVAVDLEVLKPFNAKNCVTLQADLTAPETVVRIQAELTHPTDIVLSDMAPKTSGVPFQDHVRSMELASCALNVANQLLRPGGSLVVKVFPGEDFATFKKRLKTQFDKVNEFSPEATRRSSKEIYLIAKGFKR